MRKPLSDEQVMLLMIDNSILPLIETIPFTTDRNRFYYARNYEALEQSLLTYQDILRQHVQNLRDFIANN